MKAIDLYNRLENDFIYPYLNDDFAEFIPNMHPYMTDSFKQRSMGLVCDFTHEVRKVYTAVFPSDAVLERKMYWAARITRPRNLLV